MTSLCCIRAIRIGKVLGSPVIERSWISCCLIFRGVILACRITRCPIWVTWSRPCVIALNFFCLISCSIQVRSRITSCSLVTISCITSWRIAINGGVSATTIISCGTASGIWSLICFCTNLSGVACGCGVAIYTYVWCSISIVRDWRVSFIS